MIENKAYAQIDAGPPNMPHMLLLMKLAMYLSN